MTFCKFFGTALLAIQLGFGTIATAQEAAPTNNRKDAPRAMTIVDAKRAMGFDESTANTTFAVGAKVKFAIVDAGFGGLDAWLAENPDMAGKVTYISLRKDKKKSDQSHGFKVFLTTRKVMPDANILLIEVDNHLRQFKQIVDVLKENRIYLATMSLGRSIYWGGADPSEIYSAMKLLDKYQITFFKSSGNYRGVTQAFSYRDVDGDKKLEFKSERLSNGKLAEFDTMYLPKGSSGKITLTWNEFSGRKSNFELQVFNKAGDILAHGTATTKFPYFVVRVKSKKSQTLGIRIIDKNETPPKGLKFGLIVRNAGTRGGIYNGLESLNVFSQYESPFLITVGSFGLGKSGALEPSLFSSIGHTNTGQIGPDILGPGQLLVDGEEYSGTSFATPFIAALYSAFADYNIKNVIEESSRFTPLTSGLVATEKSRFGVPDGRLILGNACSKSNKIANIRQSIEGENLVIRFELSRNCMEKLDYFVAAYLSGQKAISKRVLAPDQLRVAGKNATLRGFERKHSAERNIVAEPIQIKIPLKNIPREQFGKTLTAKIKIATKAQLAPVSLVSSLSDITFTLPNPAPYRDDVQGLKAAEIAQKALAKGGYVDAISMSERALATAKLNDAQRAALLGFRALGAIGQNDLDLLAKFATDDINGLLRQDRARVELGGVLLVQDKTTSAVNAYKGCLQASNETVKLQCQIGYVAANMRLGKDVSREILQLYPDNADQLVKSKNIHALALAVFLRKLKPAAFKTQVVESIRSSGDMASRGSRAALGFYYLGLVGIVSNNVKYARKSFRESGQLSGAILESALSRGWLRQL
jgi:hypothetical protein